MEQTSVIETVGKDLNIPPIETKYSLCNPPATGFNYPLELETRMLRIASWHLLIKYLMDYRTYEESEKEGIKAHIADIERYLQLGNGEYVMRVIQSGTANVDTFICNLYQEINKVLIDGMLYIGEKFVAITQSLERIPDDDRSGSVAELSKRLQEVFANKQDAIIDMEVCVPEKTITDDQNMAYSFAKTGWLIAGAINAKFYPAHKALDLLKCLTPESMAAADDCQRLINCMTLIDATNIEWVKHWRRELTVFDGFSKDPFYSIAGVTVLDGDMNSPYPSEFGFAGPGTVIATAHMTPEGIIYLANRLSSHAKLLKSLSGSLFMSTAKDDITLKIKERVETLNASKGYIQLATLCDLLTKTHGLLFGLINDVSIFHQIYRVFRNTLSKIADDYSDQ